MCTIIHALNLTIQDLLVKISIYFSHPSVILEKKTIYLKFKVKKDFSFENISLCQHDIFLRLQNISKYVKV